MPASDEQSRPIEIKDSQGISLGGVQYNYFRDPRQRRALILLALLIVLVGGAVVAAIRYRQPRRMNGDLRIAVAGFTVEGDENQSQAGIDLAERVQQQLQPNLAENENGLIITVWGPREPEVGALSGKGAVQRSAAAAQLAERIQADMIVYGVIDAREDPWQITPEFYLSDQNLNDANEVTGAHAWGVPFSLKGQGGVSGRLEFSRFISPRIQALTALSIGLAYYAVKDYRAALEVFASPQTHQYWAGQEGQQLLYLLVGNAAGKSGDFERAEQAYRQSLQIDPEYARARIGLAGMYYLRALQPYNQSNLPADVDRSLLDTSIADYQQALLAQHQPPQADISAKAHFGLGQCYLMQSYAAGETRFAAAAAELQSVLAAYGDGQNPRLQELAAEAHARLGLIADLSGHPELAAAEYAQAADLTRYDTARHKLYERRAQTLAARSPRSSGESKTP